MNKSLGRNKDNILDRQSDSRSISNIFEQQFHSQIFFSRCQDTGEKPDLQKANMFKQSFNKRNSKKYPLVLNLNSMRLGVNTIMKLINILENRQFVELNLADNAISEYGMHAVKNLISSTKIQHFNLASNMISEIGLSIILEEFIKNTHIKSFHLGIEEGSIRKNSFGIDGARCLAAVLLQNKTLECLKLEDNDIGINGAEIISIPLKKNKILKELKISENLIKTQGAEYILMNAVYLTSLDLGKNFIKSTIGPSLKRYVLTNKNLVRINLEYNQLLPEGIQQFFEGAVQSKLEEVNIRGNLIGDRGLQLIENIFRFMDSDMQNLSILNISSNDFTSQGIKHLIIVLNYTKIKNLNISKNSIADEGFVELIDSLKESPSGEIIQKLDVSGCKITDRGFMHFLENINQISNLKSLRCGDNYISEKYEKIFVDLMSKNTTLIHMYLKGNRLSLSGLNGMKRIVERNLKNFEEKEPKKMKSEIYNMKQKQKKIRQTQQKIERQRKEIVKLQQTKTKLNDNISKLEKQQRDKKTQHDEAMKRKTQELQSVIDGNQKKMDELQKMKEEKQKNIENLNTDLVKLRQKRKQLEYQYTVVVNEEQLIERQFEKKIKKLK